MAKEIDIPLRIARLSGAAAGVVGFFSGDTKTFLIGSGVYIATNVMYFTESFIERKRESEKNENSDKEE